MSSIRISSRYAKSLLELSKEKGQVEMAFADMQLLNRAVEENRNLEVLLTSPVVKTDKKISILNEIFEGKISELSTAFIKLLTHKSREGLLKDVAKSFILQYKAFKNITTAEITSAVKLDDETRLKIMESARKLAGGDVELVEKTDPELIGGFILKVDDRQVDTSLFNKIRNLKREFAENPYVPEL